LPWYRKFGGKITTPITEDEFAYGMEKGVFMSPDQKSYPVILYYSAVRKTEALRTVKEDFIVTKKKIVWDVGPRLKKLRHKQKGIELTEQQYNELLLKRRNQITTPALPLPIDAPYMDLLKQRIEETKQGERLWPYCPKTAYNIVSRAFKYPHLFRLSRITNFFEDGWTVAQVRNWTGLSLSALNYYIGVVDINRMGQSLKPKTPEHADNVED
jgi:hypothetical protein